MAIIKCPECGHQVSDKAPACPNCGVEIAGKVIQCPHCGEVYFKEDKACPRCHRAPYPEAGAQPQAAVGESRYAAADPRGAAQAGEGSAESDKPKKGKGYTLLISFIFTIIVCGIFYYFYESANKNKEQEAYEYALGSNDPMVLQSYLDTYKDAEEAHRDSIIAHLNMLKQVDQDWTNAIVSGSKEALEAYLQKYPNSPHKQEAWNKIDSIDWQVAVRDNSAEGYQAYLDAHADGTHIEEAEEAMKKIKSSELQPEERQVIKGLFRQFFQSINSRNEDGLTATCEDILSSLLGKLSATKQDVVTFMYKLYKEDVTNMNWMLNNDYQVKKREVGDQEYEYQVQFTARQDISKKDGTSTENTYKIEAVVSPDGKISALNMKKVTME